MGVGFPFVGDGGEGYGGGRGGVVDGGGGLEDVEAAKVDLCHLKFGLSRVRRLRRWVKLVGLIAAHGCRRRSRHTSTTPP